MKYKTSKAVIAAAKLASVVMWNEFRYPQPVKGRYDVAVNKKEKLKWAYRCWVHQLETAEKGSGIEEYFASQELDFSLPRGFVTEREMTMTAAGDLMAVDCLTEESTKRLFDGIRNFYMDADLTCANLESCIWEKAPVGRNQVLGQPPKMNTTRGMFDRGHGSPPSPGGPWLRAGVSAPPEPRSAGAVRGSVGAAPHARGGLHG